MAKRNRNKAGGKVQVRTKPLKGDVLENHRYMPLSFGLSERHMVQLEDAHEKGGEHAEKALEIAADHLGSAPQDLFDFFGTFTDDQMKARDIYNEIDESYSLAEEKDALEKAIKLDHHFYDLYASLGNTCSELEDGIKYYMEGVALAEKTLGNEITGSEEAANLYNNLNIRGYLNLLDGLFFYHFRNEQLEEALEVGLKYLSLNRRDHHGLREYVLLLLITHNKLEEARHYLNLYPNDHLLGMLVADMTLCIAEELHKVSKEDLDLLETLDDEKKAYQDLLKKLFPKSLKKIPLIIRRNPFFPILALTRAVFDVEVPETLTYQSATEAILTAQIFTPLWLALGYPLELVMLSGVKMPKKMNKEDLFWVNAVMEKMEELAGEDL